MNRRKIYLSTINEHAHSLAKEYGLGIEIAEFCTPWFLDTEFDQIDPKIKEKLTCSDRFALHAPFSELFPCAIDPKIRDIATERYRQVISVAKGYGIRKIIVHGGYNPRIYFPIWYTEQSVQFWMDFVREIPDRMVFCLENVFEEEPTMLSEIIRQVNDPKIRMCLDTGHVNAYSQISVFDWLTECSDLIEHFHIHNNAGFGTDGTADQHAPLNEGSIPMKELLLRIEQLCPDATLALELMKNQSSVEWLLEEGLI